MAGQERRHRTALGIIGVDRSIRVGEIGCVAIIRLEKIVGHGEIENLSGGGGWIAEKLVQSHGRLPEPAQHLGNIASNDARSEEHTSELQSLMRITSAVCSLDKK